MTNLRGKKSRVKEKMSHRRGMLLHSKQDRKNETGIALFLRPCLNAYDKLGVKQVLGALKGPVPH